MSALDETERPQIFEVETNCDEYAIVVAPRTMTPAQAEAYYKAHRYDEA